MYARNRDNTPVSSGERSNTTRSLGFPFSRALAAGLLALFIGSAVYWQVWFWGDDGTSLPALIVAVPLLVVAPEYVLGRSAALVGLVAGFVVGVVGHVAASVVVELSSGVHAAMAPAAIAVGSGWLVFALVTAGISRLPDRRG